MRLSKLALIVAIFAALGDIAAAALHGNPAVVGLLAALAFAAVGVAATAGAAALHAPDDLAEPRHPRGPSAPPPVPVDVLSRRGVFGRLWLWTLGAFVLAGIVPLASLARRPQRSGTAWTRGARLVTPEGRLLRADDLVEGAVETVFPEGMLDAPESATLLLRLPDGLIRLPPERTNWVQHGNVAFSKICTHAGCPVAIYRKATFELYCPCHQSVFDVSAGAAPVSGPATRALPQLGLDVDRDGYLIARGDFVDPVGPDHWWRTI